MLHKAWSSIEEVPYCFWRSSVKFQGHTALKIIKFDPNWVFPDCNSSLNSPMAMKCCTKLETAKERCPIVFQGHPSNFKVTRYKTSPILTQIGHFPTVGRSQLSNPSDLPCCGMPGCRYMRYLSPWVVAYFSFSCLCRLCYIGSVVWVRCNVYYGLVPVPLWGSYGSVTKLLYYSEFQRLLLLTSKMTLGAEIMGKWHANREFS